MEDAWGLDPLGNRIDVAELNASQKLPLRDERMFPLNSGRTMQPALRPKDRLAIMMIGFGVIFASLGLGEAVYRLSFLDFDGARDRLPIELLFGFAFAWTAAQLARRICQHRLETKARIKLVRDRNHKIRHAAEAIKPLSYPSNQQAVRVIREEVDRIEWALTDIAR
jgi:hypothetical protein